MPIDAVTGGIACRFLRRMTLTLVLAALVVSGVSASPGRQSDNKAQAEFDALVRRVRQSDPSVDFSQLRRLYAESDRYTPYGDDAEDSMISK
jgi:hypothetical protein